MSEVKTIGEILRETRLTKHYNYSDVEGIINIRAVYLAALESDAYEEIPNEAYLKGMLRSYGNFLGLDGDALVRQYKLYKADLVSLNTEQEQSSQNAHSHLVVVTTECENGIPTRVFILIILILVAMAVVTMLAMLYI